MRIKKGKSGTRGDRWAALPWKTIDLSNEDLGEYNDAVFFGLEEIDGSDYKKYISGAAPAENVEHQEEDLQEDFIDPPKPHKKKKEKKSDKKVSVVEEKKSVPEPIPIDDSPLSWANSISLHNQLVSSLKTLNFTTPTPIQTISIPIILSGNCDVVGSAETGSGKTLAFGLPVLHSLLNDWEMLSQRKRHSPYALILAPTRELAVQISTVLNDVCKLMTARKVQVVNIIGGMSEHKQRRVLSSPFKPVHIIVSTPGRLCDLISDPELVVLQDLSRLRYLVVDEADRMVEDGHFPELFKIFNQVRRHEKLASEGKDPLQEAHLTRLGTNFDEMGEEGSTSGTSRLQQPQGFVEEEDQEIGFEDTFDLHFDEMPSEADILAAQSEAPEESEETPKEEIEPYVANARQTLLYSATAMGLKKEEGDSKRRRQQLKKEHALAGAKRVAYLQSLGIPEHLRQLLETVGIQSTTEIAIATQLQDHAPVATVTGDLVKKRKSPEPEVEAPPTLPSGLKQLEIRVPAEEKDLIAYFFLLKNPGRTIIFVNSIKTARRLDGLLRALEINSRTIHAQLQQKQRLKALESFRSTPIGVLVATDVAARGLDLPRIQYVLHYDIARSPQLYIHRSGRTARAGAAGTSLSIVAPEDGVHHEEICRSLGLPSFPLLRLDVSSTPIIAERVKLAKKIFLQSFVTSQTTKQFSWLEQSAKEADLVVDDRMFAEIEDDLGAKGKRKVVNPKGSIDKDRARLKAMLNEPWESPATSQRGNVSVATRKKRPFIVVAR